MSKYTGRNDDMVYSDEKRDVMQTLRNEYHSALNDGMPETAKRLHKALRWVEMAEVKKI